SYLLSGSWRLTRQPPADGSVERDRPGSRDGQPEEQRQVLEFVESQQGFQRIDIAPLGGLDGDDHRHAQSTCRNACKQTEQKKEAAKELDARGEWREDMGKRN